MMFGRNRERKFSIEKNKRSIRVVEYFLQIERTFLLWIFKAKFTSVMSSSRLLSVQNGSWGKTYIFKFLIKGNTKISSNSKISPIAHARGNFRLRLVPNFSNIYMRENQKKNDPFSRTHKLCCRIKGDNSCPLFLSRDYSITKGYHNWEN